MLLRDFDIGCFDFTVLSINEGSEQYEKNKLLGYNSFLDSLN